LGENSEAGLHGVMTATYLKEVAGATCTGTALVWVGCGETPSPVARASAF